MWESKTKKKTNLKQSNGFESIVAYYSQKYFYISFWQNHKYKI